MHAILTQGSGAHPRHAPNTTHLQLHCGQRFVVDRDSHSRMHPSPKRWPHRSAAGRCEPLSVMESRQMRQVAPSAGAASSPPDDGRGGGGAAAAAAAAAGAAAAAAAAAGGAASTSMTCVGGGGGDPPESESTRSTNSVGAGAADRVLPLRCCDMLSIWQWWQAAAGCCQPAAKGGGAHHRCCRCCCCRSSELASPRVPRSIQHGFSVVHDVFKGKLRLTGSGIFK